MKRGRPVALDSVYSGYRTGTGANPVDRLYRMGFGGSEFSRDLECAVPARCLSRLRVMSSASSGELLFLSSYNAVDALEEECLDALCNVVDARLLKRPES